MKPQKKAVIGQKAQKTPPSINAKKRRASPEKLSPADTKKVEKKSIKKPEDTKKKLDSEKKKQEKLEKQKIIREENKRKAEERKKEKMDKAEEMKKNKVNKEIEKIIECTEDKTREKIDENLNEGASDNKKNKNQKADDKAKTDKQALDVKRKNDKLTEDKKKIKAEEITEDNIKLNNIGIEENLSIDDNTAKKKGKAIKTECKENSNSRTTKDKKLVETGKKFPDKETAKKLVGVTMMMTTGLTTGLTKSRPQKKAPKKSLLVKKAPSQLTKKFIEKKLKLVQIARDEDDNDAPQDESPQVIIVAAAAAAAAVVTAKTKKKNSILPKVKAADKKPKLTKQMKVKLPPKSLKLSNPSKKEKIKKMLANKKTPEGTDKAAVNDSKKITSKEELLADLETSQIKREICDDNREDEKTNEDAKKMGKSAAKPKVAKKPAKRASKSSKCQIEESDNIKSEDVSLEDLIKQTKNVAEDVNAKTVANSKKETEEDLVKIDLKVETMNGDENRDLGGEASPTSASDSEDNYEDEIESRGRGKQKNVDRRGGKERESSPSDERARRMRLFGFWSGPKRHRVASLNALAKVHCLYENEAGGVYLGGFCKPKSEKEKLKKASTQAAKEAAKEAAAVAAAAKETAKEDEAPAKKSKDTKETKKQLPDVIKVENNKRNLRNVPGLRGKHWDMAESSSSSASSSSSSDDDGEREKTLMRVKKRNTTRRKKPEEVMDLKDMVVCKRMASLNASAILAASYSDEKNRLGSSASESSSESEVEVIKRRKQCESEPENKRKSAARQVSGDPGEEVIKPSKKVVIVNQDTDVTITG